MQASSPQTWNDSKESNKRESCKQEDEFIYISLELENEGFWVQDISYETTFLGQKSSWLHHAYNLIAFNLSVLDNIRAAKECMLSMLLLAVNLVAQLGKLLFHHRDWFSGQKSLVDDRYPGHLNQVTR